MLIADTGTLQDFCRELEGAPYLAVDTEFLREKTYHARLCLVQVAYGEHAAAIDPLAEGMDMAPLGRLLSDATTVKVLHSASQDLGIFLRAMGHIPGPVFDTQIAASVCGFGHQPGYAGLVESMLGVAIDKTNQATDWSLRPLTDDQVNYAIGDVTHLCVIYERLLATLEERGRASWVEEEMSALMDPSKYRVDPETAYRRIKIRRPSPKNLVVLKALARWREETAVERDMPRNWIVRDEALAEIAQHFPTDARALARVRGLKESVAEGAYGRAILHAQHEALATPEEGWPTPTSSGPPPPGTDSVVALLQALLKLRSEAAEVSSPMIAKREDLEHIATGKLTDVPALSGWRRELFGQDAEALVSGELALTGSASGALEVRLPAGEA
ncbi:MAG: ribonuclease D [Planctomycetota bacterium]|nr:ribonuclease D [Planctomycetota bacterium]MDG1983071.1 ribonuclease D [Planctomycetota bacterium]